MMRPTRIPSSVATALVAFALVATSCAASGSDDAAPARDGAATAESQAPTRAASTSAPQSIGTTAGSETSPASDDGEATDPTAGDGPIQSPSMGPDEAVACAAVEFGYVGLLRSGSGRETDADLVRGAEAAIALGVESYEQAGSTLLAAVGTLDAASAADTLLDLCAERGFERLA